eukprot:7384331-Prymnesium_polylepis.1
MCDRTIWAPAGGAPAQCVSVGFTDHLRCVVESREAAEEGNSSGPFARSGRGTDPLTRRGR